MSSPASVARITRGVREGDPGRDDRTHLAYEITSLTVTANAGFTTWVPFPRAKQRFALAGDDIEWHDQKRNNRTAAANKNFAGTS